MAWMAWPLIAQAGIGAAGSIAGGLLGRSGGGGVDAHDQLKWMKKESRKLEKHLKPWRQSGKRALESLWSVLEDPSKVTEMPGYEFGFGEGTKALLRSRAATGGLQSGAAQKALTRFGQDYAGTQFRNYLEPYMRLSEQGLGAASKQGAQVPYIPPDYTGQAVNAGMAGNLANVGISGLKDYWYMKQMQGSPTNFLSYGDVPNLMNNPQFPGKYGR